MGWDFECCCPHVNLLVNIHTRNDKEHAGTPGPSSHKSAQAEYDGPLILLDNLDILFCISYFNWSLEFCITFIVKRRETGMVTRTMKTEQRVINIVQMSAPSSQESVVKNKFMSLSTLHESYILFSKFPLMLILESHWLLCLSYLISCKI